MSAGVSAKATVRASVVCVRHIAREPIRDHGDAFASAMRALPHDGAKRGFRASRIERGAHVVGTDLRLEGGHEVVDRP
ncbi:MAG: hypothetical protein NVSMB21_12190 [Vulcanimicrobiaceae bacterium]